MTLAVVGKAGYPRQQGTNEAANHAGNVVAAGLVAALLVLLTIQLRDEGAGAAPA